MALNCETGEFVFFYRAMSDLLWNLICYPVCLSILRSLLQLW